MKNKFLTLLLSLAISFGLWLYVVTVISPESEEVFRDIPVELVGNDYLNSQNLIIISSTGNLRVDLTLSGNRSDLKKLNSSNITVIADLSKIARPGEHQLECNISFQSGTAEVRGQNPEYISVVVAEKLTKTVPVKITYIGSVPDGYEADPESVSMDHTTVTVSGPKETVDRIASAGITVDLTGEMTTFVQDYPMVLCGIDGRPIADVSYVTPNVSAIRAVVQVNKVKKVPLRFELDYTDSGLSPNMVTLYPTVEVLTLIGSSDALNQVDDTLVFKIKLSDYSESSTEIFVPVLPEGVLCKEDIQVHIQIPEMVSRWVTVDNFIYENVPEGMKVNAGVNPTVEIWGPRDILEKLTANQVLGVIDCTSVILGSNYAPVRYEISEYEYLYIRVEWTNSFITVHSVEE